MEPMSKDAAKKDPKASPAADSPALPRVAGTSFTSKLDKPEQRFLAHVIEHGLAVGRRSPADFVRHFPPSAIMAGLDRRPDLRADILVATTGIRQPIALRKDAASSGIDLQIALDEAVATAEDIVALFGPDDRVRYLDPVKLWAFVVEGEFWKTDRSRGALFERAKEHIAFMLERALADGLINHQDLVNGVSVDAMAEALPRQTLGAIIKAALALGAGKQAFTEKDLMATAAARVLVEDVSLVHIWETVIGPKIAVSHGFADKDAAGAVPTAIPVAVEGGTARTASRPEKQPSGKQAAADARSPKLAVKKPPAKAGGKKDGLEELLVDVEDFEIEELDEDYETSVGGGGGPPN
jgi:hypothetical protein